MKVKYAEAWNFGPSDKESITVEQVVKNVKNYWDKIDYEINNDVNQPYEANLLKLDCSKANMILKWHEVWPSKVTFEKTVNWYKKFYEEQMVLTLNDLQDYLEDAKTKGLTWTKN